MNLFWSAWGRAEFHYLLIEISRRISMNDLMTEHYEFILGLCNMDIVIESEVSGQ
ncbi:MAG: hypothetical protein ABI045_00460 [Flavobacteriales bacterium]